MARDYIENSKIILEEALEAFRKGVYNRVIRLSQESVELALKGMLRLIGIEYPKVHDVSDVLNENRDRFPSKYRSEIDYLIEASTWLTEKRGVAMYGDERKGIPPSKLFTYDDAKKALEYANKVYQIVELLFKKYHR